MENERAYYQSIDSVEEGNASRNAHILHKYIGREVIVGIRAAGKENIFVSGVLLTRAGFYLCEQSPEERRYNPIALNTEKITGLLVKISPQQITLPGSSKVDLSVRL